MGPPLQMTSGLEIRRFRCVVSLLDIENTTCVLYAQPHDFLTLCAV